MSDYKKNIAQNKKAYFEYFIEEKFDVGIILKGSEVKSIRAGKLTIADTHAAVEKGELYLYNCHIAEYEQANRLNHDTKRPKKLLLRRQEMKKIIGKIKLKGYTLIVLAFYFNAKNLIKLELGLAKGKKLHDKRQSIKEKGWQREQAITMRNKRQ